MTRIITDDVIEGRLDMESMVDALETMFLEMGRARAITDSREDLICPVDDPPEGAVDPVYYTLKSMGGVIPAFDIGAIRINSDVLHWPQKGSGRVREQLPAADGRYTGLVLLFSTETGEPLAIYPDDIVQSYRVGATSAIGAKYLAREDSTTLGILGAGWQARAHLRAHAEVWDLDRVRVYSPTPESREEYVREMAEEFDFEITAVEEPRTVFEGTDIVQTTTNALSPVFDADWIEPGQHLGVIHHWEAPHEIYDPEAWEAFAQSWSHITQVEEIGHANHRDIYTKNINSYVVEGDEPVPKLAQLPEEPLCDWSQVPGIATVMTDDDLGRTTDEGKTFFYNQGMGIQFAAAGKVVYDLAESEDLGHVLPDGMLTQENPG